MTDDSELLASAYLDGDVTAEERARVETDPALLAHVDALRAAREQLRDVEPLGDERTSDLVASALAARQAWRNPPRPIPAPSWRSPGRWLAAAAAVLAIGAVGVVAATTLNSGSSDDDSAAVFVADTDADAADDGASGGADAFEDESARTEAAEGAGAPAAPLASEAPSELADVATEETTTAAGELGEHDAAGRVVLVGPDELAAYGSASAEPDQAPMPAVSACEPEPGQRVVGPATYAAAPGGTEREVVVVVDDDAGVVSALDATTCQPVAAVPAD